MTDRTRNILTLFVVLAALIGVGVAAVVKEPVLGLDLQGGLEVTLKAVPKPGQEVTDEQIDTALGVIRDRVDALGVSEPEIRKEGTDRIVVGLAGVEDPDQAARVIKSTAQLIFLDMEKNLVPVVSRGTASGQPVPRNTLYALLKAAEKQKLKATENASEFYAFDPETKERLAGPRTSEKAVLAAVEPSKRADAEVLKVPGGFLSAACDTLRGCPGQVAEGAEGKVLWYLFSTPAETESLPGTEVSDARQDFDTTTGEPIVLMDFTGKGGDRFEQITKTLAERGASEARRAGDPGNVDYAQHFAVILDGRLETWPQIDFAAYPNGITGGNGAQISGIGNVQEAKDVALVLQTGSLPIKFDSIQETQVSATLGEDSLRQGLIAGLVGLVIVMLYMIIYYRVLGVIATIALLIYGALFYGLILLIPITMTLPGIAGMVLTIGVAADANIVIFERIREEAQTGKSVRAAVSAGYTKGFKTIVDANVITLITAAVLFLAGTGSVKGFAFTLAVGVILSLFSAVLSTRAMLGLLGRYGWFNNATLMGTHESRLRWRWDIVGRWKTWFALSGVVLLISAASLVINGLNLGIDFEGGTRVSATLGQAATVEQVRNSIEGIDPLIDDAIIQGQGDAVGDKRYQAFKIQAEELQSADVATLKQRLDGEFAGISKDETTQVSASFGREILDSALLAIIFSLILIVGYVTARFEFRYAVPMLVALFHDMLISIGVYSLTGREMTAATVAALLTILGYSLYDTIIIFDRVRENQGLLRKLPYRALANQSLWETLTRSLNTSLITLIPILTLLLFGGATLKDFAFALLVGIACGAYSTVFIATPLLALIKEREPEYRKLRAAADGTVPVPRRTLRADAAPVPATVGAPATADEELTEAEAEARDAARRRRMERKRQKPHGRPR